MAEQVQAEMVSTVFELVADVGQRLEAGDTIVVLESMKMEIPVLAETAGTLTSLDVAVGDTLRAGDPIATIS